MRARLLAVPLLVGLIGTFVVAWDAMLTQAFSDYETEAEPAFTALRMGHFGSFVDQLPSYGGSLILRAPFVLFSQALGGGALSAYRWAAVPALLAGLGLGVYLWTRVEKPGGAYLALALATMNPVTLRALEIGHPEELLGTVFVVAAILCALADRDRLAGLMLGLAFANKAWAVLAVGPVLLALPGMRERVRASLVAALAAGIVLAPMILGHSAGITSASQIARSSGVIFQPWQVWWFLGHHGFVPTHPGYRIGPTWISPLVHPAIGLMGFPLTLIVWWRRRSRADALPLLILLFQLRCVLDPWNIIYYELPVVLLLLVWEVRERRAAPVLSLIVTLAPWVTMDLMPNKYSSDVQSVAYMAWALPLLAVLALRVFAPDRFTSLVERLSLGLRRRLPSLVAAVSA